MTEVPIKFDTENDSLNRPEEIMLHIIRTVSPDITNDKYKIIKSFNPKEGQDKYSVKMVFTCSESKKVEL